MSENNTLIMLPVTRNQMTFYINENEVIRPQFHSLESFGEEKREGNSLNFIEIPENVTGFVQCSYWKRGKRYGRGQAW